MPLFDYAAILAVQNAVVSEARQLGVFERAYAHEPKSPPGSGRTLAFWWDAADPYARGSGLTSVTGRITYMGRVYRSFLPRDEEDKIDADLLAAVSAFFGALTSAFTLFANVRNVDLLGESGQALSAKAAYLDLDGKPYRVADLTVPVIISDIWTEAA